MLCTTMHQRLALNSVTECCYIMHGFPCKCHSIDRNLWSAPLCATNRRTVLGCNDCTMGIGGEILLETPSFLFFHPHFAFSIALSVSYFTSFHCTSLALSLSHTHIHTHTHTLSFSFSLFHWCSKYPFLLVWTIVLVVSHWVSQCWAMRRWCLVSVMKC